MKKIEAEEKDTNITKPTLLYINFSVDKQLQLVDKNNDSNCSGEEISIKKHNYLFTKIKSIDPSFFAYWEKVEKIIYDNWQALGENGSLYIKSSQEHVHYIKVLLDEILGKENFLNEIIWVKDINSAQEKQSRQCQKQWQKSHENILVYVKNKNNYVYNVSQIDREPYMAPTLVSAEKVSEGKLPTDTWWYTITDTEAKVLTRIIKASTFEKDFVAILFDDWSTLIKNLNRQVFDK